MRLATTLDGNHNVCSMDSVAKIDGRNRVSGTLGMGTLMGSMYTRASEDV